MAKLGYPRIEERIPRKTNYSRRNNTLLLNSSVSKSDRSCIQETRKGGYLQDRVHYGNSNYTKH